MFNIALNTFREIIRNRFFSLIIFLSVILISLSLGLDSLALGENKRVIIDFGLSFIELSGLAVILFLGGWLIAREIEWRTIYLMLSKPIARGSIIFGKFIGFTLVVGLIVAIETALLIGICLSQGVLIDTVFLISIACIAIKLLSLLSLILLFSTFVSTGLAIFMTIASAIIGHGGYTMLDYAIRHQDSVYAVLARTILVAFPNLESLNLKSLVGTSATIDLTSYMIAMLLGLIYTFVILMLAAHTFQKKSFDTV